MSNQNDDFGYKLLGFSAWLRAQPGLKAIYRHFPLAIRKNVSKALAARATINVKFKRTRNWDSCAKRRVPQPTKKPVDSAYANAVGINIFAYARGQFGLAEGARLYARALLAEGYPVAINDIDINLPQGMGDTSLDQYIGKETPYGVNLLFVNPDYIDAAIRSIGQEGLGNRYTIACWFWELEVFPDEWMHALELVDEVMVSTSFIETAVKRITEKPVMHVPLPVNEVDDSGLTRPDFGLDEDAFIFFSSFDFNSFLARKNPIAVIEAFKLAFSDGRTDVRLLIKSSNGHHHPASLRELLNAASTDHRIMIRDEVLDRRDIQALQRCTDAYVSLHRAEGFGLGLAECMRMGKPVIATGWSGNMDFMTNDNSCLVDYNLVPVTDGEYLHHVGQRWADPSIEHAAAHMRRLANDPEFSARIGKNAADDIRSKLSSELVALQIIRRIESLSCFVGDDFVQMKKSTINDNGSI